MLFQTISKFLGNQFDLYTWMRVQAYLGDVMGSVPDHQNKVNIALKQ